MKTTFTSESVTEGHPDKMADQISDAVLDAMLEGDPASRVACETLLTTGLVVVAGEVTTSTYVDIAAIARETVCEIGYDNDAYGFNGKTCGVHGLPRRPVARHRPGCRLGLRVPHRDRRRGHAQRPGRRRPGDDVRLRLRRDARPHAAARSGWPTASPSAWPRCGASAPIPYLRPDGKTQVSVVYEDGRPVRIDTVLISTQHAPGIDLEEQLLPDLTEHVINPLLPGDLDTEGVRILANPTGIFELGGPHADTGLTGRKIIVDTYGGMARHGGGAFSGKDPSKVDRSAAYAARWVAKHVVASGAATRCEVQVAYAIGVAHPVSLMVETFGTEAVDPEKISEAVREVFDLRPAAIARDLDLRRPIYKKTAAYGHFGRSEKEFTWEATPRVDDLRSALGL